eukprot:4325562-Amphidinium_carterae.1
MSPQADVVQVLGCYRFWSVYVVVAVQQSPGSAQSREGRVYHEVVMVDDFTSVPESVFQSLLQAA